ncbi:MAG TPA: glycosyltransferase family 2 protein [Beijerinckiaceae bacterium]|nr:glycosyltransferase family 2 protein [Beijerinckiaceae bacterium]
MSVSIVVPAYRATGTLARTLLSCREAVRPPDLIVVLDGEDAPLEDVARTTIPGAKVVVLPAGSGAPMCRNTGLRLVSSPYVMFLDADDYIEGQLLASAAEAAGKDAADVVLGSFSFEYPDGRRDAHNPATRYEDLSCGTVLKRWLSGGYTPPCSVIWRTDYVRTLGGWDETLAKNQDGDLIHRALMQGVRITTAPKGQGIYVQDDNPGRITRKQTPRTLQSQIRALDKIRIRLEELPFDPQRELALAYYALARLGYNNGMDDLGAIAEAAARDLGLSGQHGSPGHVALASLLGLRNKQRLARFVRSLS